MNHHADGVDLGVLGEEIRAEAARLRALAPTEPATRGTRALGPDWALLGASLGIAGSQLEVRPWGKPRGIKGRIKHLLRATIGPHWRRFTFRQKQYNYFLLQSVRAAADGLRLLEERLHALEAQKRGK